MKKFSKILIMILSLALLIGSVVAVGASAEETNTREILAKNVAYTDKVTMLFAVDASLDEAIAGTVKVAYYWEEDGVAVIKEAKLLYPYDENGNDIEQYIYPEGGKKHPVFYTEGVPAKELGREVKIVAYTGTLPEDAEFETYSVAEYFYARLYKDGVAGATEGKDVYRKATYENLLAYAASAQELLVNYGKADADKAVLVTDYTYVVALGAGTTVNGGATALFRAGEAEITLAYTGELTGNQELIGWTVTDAEGNSVDYTSNTITVSGAVTVAPMFGEHECVDENPADHVCDLCLEKCSDCSDTIDGDHNCDICGKLIGECVDTNTDGKCDECNKYNFNVESMSSTANIQFVNIAANSGTDYTEAQNSVDLNGKRPATHTKGTWLYLCADPTNAANTVLAANSISASSMTDDTISDIMFTPDVQVADGDLIVLEFDYYVDGCTNNKNSMKFVYGYADDTVNRTNATYATSAGVRLNADADGSHRWGLDAWVKVRVVCDNTNKKIYTFVAIDGTANYVQCETVSDYTGSVSSIGFTYIGYGVASTQYYDNLVCVRTNAATYGISFE